MNRIHLSPRKDRGGPAGMLAIMRFLLPTCVAWSLAMTPLSGGESPGRAFVACDLNNACIVRTDASGAIVWSLKADKVHDVWELPGGGILYAHPSEIVEIDAQKKVTWTWKAPAGQSLHTCQPLANGNILTATQSATATRILEITRAGTIALDITTPTRAKEIRLCRKTGTGTYLLAARGSAQVWELDATGRQIRTITVPGNVYLAVRLPGGDTMISCGDTGHLLRVDAQERITWDLGPTDLPGIPLRFVAGFQVLANGNVILCNWGGHGHLRKQAQIVEVTPDKRVVWALHDWERFSTPAHVQVAEDVPVTALRR